jgi:outer membrane protein OmpA-like peptidoglycan-associated protein
MIDPRTIAPRLGVFGIAVAAACAAACGPKNVSGPNRPDQALIVLLPDEDGSTGRAVVSNPAGSADLTQPRSASNVTTNRRPEVSTMSEADVRRLFGAALDALPPAPQSFTLYFRFDSDELTEESKALLPKILGTVKERSAPEVVVVGHTDTMGTPAANFALGLKRAAAVRELLVASGLDAAIVEATSLGESFPLVRTPDETPEPRNRRVEIAVK